MVAQLDTSGWRAALELRYESRADRTVLAHRRHVGPLVVQRPFYPEGGICHSYIVHPPGGVVGGDELTLDVDCGAGAHAVITTPAAAKFYRSEGAIARQLQRLSLTRASLEWLPQETIYYPGACARSTTRVHIDAESRFIGWEVVCLGLPARKQPFDAGALQLGFELWSGDTPRYLDRLQVRGGADALTAAWGWADQTCLGTMLAWPARREWVELARSVQSTAVQIAVTLVDGVLVCRGLGQQAESVRAALIDVWQVLRPALLGIPAVRPRIWAT
ncbi:MAG: urease accessory protein UreD [Steroidobacteraceae bacterium]